MVPAAFTRLLSLSPSVTHLSLNGFHRFADDTFSFSLHAPNINRLDLYNPGEESLIPGGERLRYVGGETVVGIAEILDTVRSLDLYVSTGDITELAQTCTSRPPLHVCTFLLWRLISI